MPATVRVRQTGEMWKKAGATAMRYLAELAWAPHAIAANQELGWREVAS